MSLALNVSDNSQALSLSLWRPHYRRTLELELPIFLNLLKVTTESGLTLPQSLKCLNQTLDSGCPHLVKMFAIALERANATDVSLSDTLIEASKETKVDFVANLMTALAVPTATTDELLSILNRQTAIANSRQENKCIRLRKNYLRRWAPHVLFFFLFSLPLIVTPMLGPALQPCIVIASGPHYSRTQLIDTAMEN